MTRVILTGLATRRARTLMTALSIVVGVAMVAGALTLSDTLRHAANSLSDSSYRGTDAAVVARTAFTTPAGDISGGTPTVPAALLRRVRSVPQVGLAVGDLTNPETQIISARGKVLGSGPYFGVGLDPQATGSSRLTPFRLVRGHFAARPGQVVIDAGTASAEHLTLGDAVRIESHGPARRFTVSGVATFGAVKSIGTATFALFDLPTAQAMFRTPGRFDSILVAARPGVSAADLRHALASALGSSARVETARAQDRFDLAGLKQFVSIIEIVLLAFGGVALFVGAFTIANTLSITVAQRSRELAVLRAIGASRRQVRRSVVAEALIVGSTASVLGLFAGLGLASGLGSLLASAGIDLPSSGTVFAAHTVVIALLTGILATVLASLSAARRATRVAPVVALREASSVSDPVSAQVSRRGATAGGIGLALVAAGLFAGGVSGGTRALMLVPGVLLLFTGLSLLAPLAVPWVGDRLGAIIAAPGGMAGRLARRNVIRNPRRTAASASPLMIGVTLVVLLAVVATGMRSAAEGSILHSVRAPYVVAAGDGFSPVPSSAAAAVSIPGAMVSAVKQSEGEVFGRRVTINGVDPSTIGRAFRFDYARGSDSALASLSHGGALVDSGFAAAHHLSTGSRFQVRTAAGRSLSLVVSAVERPIRLGAMGLGKVTITSRGFQNVFPGAQDRLVFVQLSGGAAAQRQLAGRLATYPNVDAYTASGFAAKQVQWLSSVLAVFYVLLALAVIISLFGIANTLALSTFERTRELGTLRALGMNRRQARRMVRYESVITAVMGVLEGIAVGLGLAALVTIALRHDGLRFALPVGSLVAFLVIAVGAGVAAAVVPARRAARLNPLAALAYE